MKPGWAEYKDSETPKIDSGRGWHLRQIDSYHSAQDFLSDYFRRRSRPTRDKTEGFGICRLCCWTYRTIQTLAFACLRGLGHAPDFKCR